MERREGLAAPGHGVGFTRGRARLIGADRPEGVDLWFDGGKTGQRGLDDVDGRYLAGDDTLAYAPCGGPRLDDGARVGSGHHASAGNSVIG